MLAVRLDKDTENRLATLATETGRSKTFYVKEAIERYLQNMEEIYLAERSLERFRAGEKTYHLSEMKARHGLAD